MDAFFATLSFWGQASTALAYVVLAIWIVHKYGTTNRQQIVLIAALASTASWGLASAMTSPVSAISETAETGLVIAEANPQLAVHARAAIKTICCRLVVPYLCTIQIAKTT